MTPWERTILNAFIESYSLSAAESGRNSMRLRSVSVFPGFDGAGPDEKESYLEAAEALERRGLLTLNWEKRGKGERIKTLACADMGALFREAGGTDPKTLAEEIRTLLRGKVPAFAEQFPRAPAAGTLRYLAENFSPADSGRGIDARAIHDLFILLESFPEPEKADSATRALSVMLYHDSKRLESLMELFGPLFSRLLKQGIPVPDFSFLERSFPEASVSGKLVFEYQDGGKNRRPLLTNDGGLFLSLPLPGIREIKNIRTVDPNDSPSVLTVENKETFFVLGGRKKHGGIRGADGRGFHFDCCLYTGGYPNQAAAALIRILAASGFAFYHAGDLDPDGILIIQNIMDIAERPVTPLRMDAATFDRYLPWARPLENTVPGRTEKIREDTRAIPGLAELIRRIEETRRGVEQEIIDYGNS